MNIRRDKPGLDATKAPTALDVAWAAGIYEGEGSCVAGGTKGKSFSVTVTQKDPELLYRCETFSAVESSSTTSEINADSSAIAGQFAVTEQERFLERFTHFLLRAVKRRLIQPR